MKTETNKEKDCCKNDGESYKHGKLSEHKQTHTTWGTAVSATIHCLIGCSIGEFLGLFIGVSLGMSVAGIIILDTTLAYISGFTLGLVPIMRREKVSFRQALKIIWLGEFISIAVMEFAMNFTDYHMGGMTVGSVLHWKFWIGFLIALPAGFIAALPVNYWLLKKHIKGKCH